MNKENIKNNKVIYCAGKATKKLINGARYFSHHVSSLRYISKNKRRVQKKIRNKEVLNVIFVVQYIPGWNKLEPIYDRMKNDNRFNPIIVCVPFNIQDHKLLDDDGNDTYEYFVQHGYETMNALNDDGSWLDLKELSPDYLFHSRPYNSVMPNCYISSKIVKYALICNVLYGASVTTDIRFSVINKDYYKDVYCFFAVDKGECRYYNKRFNLGHILGITKSLPYGAIGLEQMLNARTNRTKDQFRKKIIWTPRWSTDSKVGGSNFFNYKDVIIEFAKEYQDILFIIRPHPLMFGNFIKTGEMSEQEVDKFKSYCNQQNNIILDESKEYANTFWNSDMLISDVSSIVPEYFITKKPIIYCHSNINYKYTEFADDMIHTCYEAFNEADLKKFVTDLINDSDDKLFEREKCLNVHFRDVQKNSSNILESLAGI